MFKMIIYNFVLIIGLLKGLVSNPNPIEISFDEFSDALTSNSYPKPSYDQYQKFVVQMVSRGGISSKREAAMFLAQMSYESAGLVVKKDPLCMVTQCTYSYPNTPGIGYPGKYYWGRGYYKLKWDFNYQVVSKDLYNDDRLLKNPDQVADDEETCWATSFWFWKKYVGSLSDVKNGKFGSSTNVINGDSECRGNLQNYAKLRFNIYKNVMLAFHIYETPNESGCYN